MRFGECIDDSGWLQPIFSSCLHVWQDRVEIGVGVGTGIGTGIETGIGGVYIVITLSNKKSTLDSIQ